MKPENAREFEKRRKCYNALIGMITSEEPFEKNIQYLFKEVSHKPIEDLMYDAVIYGVTPEEAQEHENDKYDKYDTYVKMGAKLYYLHSCFNLKLERGSYAGTNLKDEFLLRCIVREIGQRIPKLIPDVKSYCQVEDNELAKCTLYSAIYDNYIRSDFKQNGEELYVVGKEKDFPDFISYLDHLLRLNIYKEWNSFSHFWQLANGNHRNYHFKSRFPKKEELYIFCIAAAFGYDTYEGLKDRLCSEIEKDLNDNNEELLKKRYGGANQARSMRMQYEETNRRDKKIHSFLRDIHTRLGIASGEVKESKRGNESIPKRMIINVNGDLEKFNFDIIKLRKKK